MKINKLFFPWFFLFVSLISFSSQSIFADTSTPHHAKLHINNQTLNVEVVSSDFDRMKGLGNRKELAKDTGMLFIFDSEDIHGIWMRDMQFPIDILWLDKNMQVIAMKENVSQWTYPLMFYPNKPAKYVLEINAGAAKRYDIKVGDVVEGL